MELRTLSKRDISLIQETAYVAHQVSKPAQLPALMKWITQFVPSEYSACAHFSFTQSDLSGVAYSNYNVEFCQLYMAQGLVHDPAVVFLAGSHSGQTSSLDNPPIVIPQELLALKLDFGIKTCQSFAIRGIKSPSVYLAFSNFDARYQRRLNTILTIIGPHVFLAYMRAHAHTHVLQQPKEALTAREHEIMKWVQEGKTNWEISVILNVSLNTIKFHLKNIMHKLGVENRCAAAAHWQGIMNQQLTWPESSLPLENLLS